MQDIRVGFFLQHPYGEWVMLPADQKVLSNLDQDLPLTQEEMRTNEVFNSIVRSVDHINFQFDANIDTDSEPENDPAHLTNIRKVWRDEDGCREQAGEDFRTQSQPTQQRMEDMQRSVILRRAVRASTLNPTPERVPAQVRVLQERPNNS